jgi:hypothetical protein
MIIERRKHKLALRTRLPQQYTNDTAAFRLVVASSHPAEAIEIRGLVPLSIFIFSATQFVAQTDE